MKSTNRKISVFGNKRKETSQIKRTINKYFDYLLGWNFRVFEIANKKSESKKFLLFDFSS